MKIYFEIFLIVVAVAIIGYLFFYSANILFAPVTVQNPQNQVCFGKNCFFVQLAKNQAEREKGLMNVKQMDANKGMLFVFDKEGNYPFWMENTLIPLDMIWIGADYKVVFVAQNVQPCRTLICPVTNPQTNAKYVLEINAGLSSKLNIKTGDAVLLKIVN